METKEKKCLPVDLDLYELRHIALSAMVDIKTLERVLTGEKVRPSSMIRVRKALADRALLHVLPGSGK